MAKGKARQRENREPGGMNQTEARYARGVLDVLIAAGEVRRYDFEGLKFKVGAGSWYTPDFVVYRSDGLIELVDVKGSGGWLNEGAYVRIRAAAALHPEYVWVGAIEVKGSRGVFKREEFSI